MLKIENLSIGYNNRVVASGITVRIAPGQLVALLGRNGVGKSTLLRTIAGFLPPIEGEISFCAADGAKIPGNQKSNLSKILSIVLTERPPSRQLTLRKLVEMGRTPYTGFFGRLSSADDSIVADSMRQVGILELSDKLLSAASDGELQKAMIAKALAQQTPIILLDEPTAFLDFESRVALLRMLRQLAHEKQKTILLTTHDINLVLHLSDSLWLMEDGRLNVNPSRSDINEFVGAEAARFL